MMRRSSLFCVRSLLSSVVEYVVFPEPRDTKYQWAATASSFSPAHWQYCCASVQSYSTHPIYMYIGVIRILGILIPGTRYQVPGVMVYRYHTLRYHGTWYDTRIQTRVRERRTRIFCCCRVVPCAVVVVVGGVHEALVLLLLLMQLLVLVVELLMLFSSCRTYLIAGTRHSVLVSIRRTLVRVELRSASARNSDRCVAT